MLYPTHAAAGALAAATLAEVFGAPVASALVAGALGALLPDLDSQQSKGARLFPALAVVASAALLWRRGWTRDDVQVLAVVAVAAPLAPWLLAKLLGHRGPLHSVFVHAALGAAAAAAAAVADWPAWTMRAALFVAVGAIGGGLLLDACTIRGVPLLWPVRHEVVHLVPPRWRFRTGGRRELVVRAALFALLAGLVWLHHRHAPATQTGAQKEASMSATSRHHLLPVPAHAPATRRGVSCG
jgi:membrane-bound metal-dependent hydrolase YbcI (DUF457 family)